MAQQNARKGHKGEAVAISAGIAALAAASYYFFGPKGDKHRRELKSWSIKMRGEVVEKMEKLKDVSEPVYKEIVDAVAAKYVKQEGAARADIEALATDLKRTWRSIAASVASSGKKTPSSRPKKRAAAGKKRASSRTRGKK